jgi:O-antigen ligase
MRNNNTVEQSIHSTLLLILFLVLPLPHALTNATIVLLLLLSLILQFKKKEFPKIHVSWFLPCLFLYYILSEFISGGEWSSMEKRLILIAVPLLFSINHNFSNAQQRNKIYSCFILGNLVAVFICSGRAIVRSLAIINDHWVFNPTTIQGTGYDFLTSSIMGGNYFFGDEFSVFHDSIYFAIYIVIAQFLVFELFKSVKGKTWRILLIISYIILFSGLFLLSSKAAIISSLLLNLCILFYALFKYRIHLLMKSFLTLVGVTIWVLFIYFNPRLSTFKNTFWEGMNINPNAKYGHSLRVLSWDASLDVIKHHWLFGVGEANKTSALVKVYENKHYSYPAEQKFNSHNQYLDFLIGGGIICFGLYMTGLIDLLIRSIKLHNYALLAFLLIFSFNAFFENLLSRHSGLLIFSLFICLLDSKESFSVQTE